MKKISAVMLLFATSLYAQQSPINIRGRFLHNKQDSVAVESSHGWRRAAAIDKNGNFAITIQQGIAMFSLHYGDREIDLFLTNETDMNMSADANRFVETLAFEGAGASENNFLAEKEYSVLKLTERFNDSIDLGNVPAAADSLSAGWKEQVKKGDFHYMFKTLAGTSLNVAQPGRLARDIEKQIKAAQLIGKPSPDFELENHKGGTKSLKDFKGKYVYIDVWATWCGPCLGQIPSLQKLEEKYKDKKIAFISISIDTPEDREKWRGMVTAKSLGGTQLIAENAWKSAFAVGYGIRSIPRFILLDPKGKIIETDAKRPVDPELEKQLDALLK